MQVTSLRQTINRALAVFGVAGLAACVVLLMQQNTRIMELVAAQDSLDRRFTSEINVFGRRLDEQSQALSSLDYETAELRTQITTLSRYASQSAAGSSQNLSTSEVRLSPSLLARGIYALAPDIGDTDEIGMYTVHHLTMTVEAAQIIQTVHVGIANRGFLSRPQFYFDYNNDGKVDTEMGRKALEAVIGNWVSGTLDPELAQRIYDRFLASVGRADYIAPEQIGETGNAIVGTIWSALVDAPEQISVWLSGDSTEELPSTGSREP